MRYTLRQLEYFVAAGETGSITLASERVHISQPSISTAISHLERELGVQLFIRHHAQGLSLTSAGRTVLREAKVVIGQAEGLYDVASDAGTELRGRLSIGCMVTLAPMLAPELMQSFMSAYPLTELSAVEGNLEQIVYGLRRAEIDVAITYDLQIPEDTAFTPLVSLPPHVLLAETHRFAARHDLALEELVGEPMVLLDLPLSREYFLGLFEAAGVQPTVSARSPNQEVVRTMVANGYGYSLFNVRPRCEQAMDGRRLVPVPLSGRHKPLAVGVATLRQLAKSRLVSAFEQHCTASISASHVPGMVAPGERPGLCHGPAGA